MRPRTRDDPDVYALPVHEQLLVLVDQHCEILVHSLDGLSEAEARRSLVASSTTILGLVKHATFVERVWCEEAVSGQPRTDSGIAADPEESFDLPESDAIETVLADYGRAIEHSRRAIDGLGLDAVVPGNRRGALPMPWILLHVLRELAQLCGHADIIREQLIADRT